jgi:hypothetical protein
MKPALGTDTDGHGLSSWAGSVGDGSGRAWVRLTRTGFLKTLVKSDVGQELNTSEKCCGSGANA